MDVRRTRSRSAAPSAGRSESKPKAEARSAKAANKVAKPAKGWGPPATKLDGARQRRDGFQSERIRNGPANASNGFVRPTQGQWTLDAKGQPADPVTIYAHGSLDQIESALSAAGWSKADSPSLISDAKYGGAAVADEAEKAVEGLGQRLDGIEAGVAGFFGLHPKPLIPKNLPGSKGLQSEVNEMPVSPQTYNGHPIAAAFERNNNPLGGRDHLRIFDTGQRDASGKEVYAIAASQDAGIRFAPDHPETGFMFHTVTPNVAGERDAVLQSLQQGGRVSNLEKFALPWTGSSVYGEKVGDGAAYELSLG